MSEASGRFKAKNMMPFYVALFMMLFSSVLIRFVPPSTRLCTTTSARQSTRRSTRTPARRSSPPSTKRNARPSKNFKGFLLKRIQPKPYFSGTTPSLRRSVRQPTRRRTRKFAKLSTTPSSTQSVRPSTRPWLRRSVSWSELSQIFNNRSWMKHWPGTRMFARRSTKLRTTQWSSKNAKPSTRPNTLLSLTPPAKLSMRPSVR